MKKKCFVFLISIFVSVFVPQICGASAVSGSKPPLKVCMVQKVSDRFKSNDMTDTILWKGISRSDEFGLFAYGRKDKAMNKTYFKAAYNSHGLFLKIICYEKDINSLDFSRLSLERDKSSVIFSKPVVEIFLDPLFSRKISAQLVVNINGGIYDRLNTATAAWNLNFHTVVIPHKKKGFYFVYLMIPWKNTGYENPEVYIFSMTPATNPVIGFNIAREQMIGNGEMSQWNPTQVQFMKPDQFGAMVFSGEPNVVDKMLSLFTDEMIAGGIEIQGADEKIAKRVIGKLIEHKQRIMKKNFYLLNAEQKKKYQVDFDCFMKRCRNFGSHAQMKQLLKDALFMNQCMEKEIFDVLKNEIFDEI